MARAILLLNLGGPENQGEVKDFLQRLFEDPEIIRVKFAPLRRFIAWAISTSRERTSQQMYARIGGGSPIKRLSDEQSRALEHKLKSQGKDVVVRTAFTCSKPLVEEIVRDLAGQGVDRFLNVPTYPQFSFTTTKGANDRTAEAVRQFAPRAKLFNVGSFPVHPDFIEAHADLIRQKLKEFSSTPGIHIIFSAHSIPLKLVTDLGDPYKDEMEKSVEAILRKIQWSGGYTLAWQSKLGPVKWLAPSTEETIVGLGNAGIKKVLVVPVAFVTDHIETLFEIDQMLSETARDVGITEFKRTPGLNSHPAFINCLADLALGQTEFWK